MLGACCPWQLAERDASYYTRARELLGWPQWLWNVLPGAPLNNVFDCGYRHAEHLRQFALAICALTIPYPDLADLFICQFCLCIGRAMLGRWGTISSLLYGILHVVHCTAKPEMMRVTATTIITQVANKGAARNLATVNDVGRAMSKHAFLVVCQASIKKAQGYSPL